MKVARRCRLPANTESLDLACALVLMEDKGNVCSRMLFPAFSSF
jgi:hypothetical protein